MIELATAAPSLTLANYVNGEWVPSAGGQTYERHNPWQPDDIVGSFPSSAAADVEAAVEAAATAAPRWSTRPMAHRAQFLLSAAAAINKRVDTMAYDMVRETGKPFTEARAEASRVAEIFRYSAGEAFRAT